MPSYSHHPGFRLLPLPFSSMPACRSVILFCEQKKKVEKMRFRIPFHEDGEGEREQIYIRWITLRHDCKFSSSSQVSPVGKAMPCAPLSAEFWMHA